MNSRTTTHRPSAGRLLRVVHFALGLSCAMLSTQVAADETCLSPYMAKIVGQEDFIQPRFEYFLFFYFFFFFFLFFFLDECIS